MHFKNLLTIASLISTAYFSLATSSRPDDRAPTNGSIYVISDCTVPTTEAVVYVSNSTVIAPGGTSFVDFGFPAATLTQSMTGYVNGVMRECTVTYGEDGYNNADNRWLYSCFEGGRYRCSIFTKPQ